MPSALQIKLKAKAAAENMTFSQSLLNLILNQGLTGEEIKSLLNKKLTIQRLISKRWFFRMFPSN